MLEVFVTSQRRATGDDMSEGVGGGEVCGDGMAASGAGEDGLRWLGTGTADLCETEAGL